MKIAIISDFHLGAKWGGTRGKDPFDQAEEAFEKALDLGAGLILAAGDIFDSRTPSQEVWSKAMKIISLASEKENQGLTLLDTIGKDRDEITALPLRGTPVVAIYGNHERRGKGFVDSIEALEAAGLLIRLHHNSIVLDTPDGEVAIHGMGYVPGRHAPDLLEKWNPNAIDGAKNILMVHQGLGRFTFSKSDVPTLKPEDLPEGFDLYVSGHVHYRAESEVHGRPLLFPGSTIRTQLLPVEAENPKGFFLVEFEDSKVDIEFVELESVRDFFYKKLEFENVSPREVEDKVRSEIEEIVLGPFQNEEKRPLVRIRLTGTLSKESSRSEINFKGVADDCQDDILLKISREGLTSSDLEDKTQFLKDLREEKISMEERGLKILESNLDELDYDKRFGSRELYDLLSEDRVDEAFDRISEKIEELIVLTVEGEE